MPLLGSTSKLLLVTAATIFWCASIITLFPSDQSYSDEISSRIAAYISIPISSFLFLFSLYITFSKYHRSSSQYKTVSLIGVTLGTFALVSAGYSGYLWYRLSQLYECPVCDPSDITDLSCSAGGDCYCSETCWIWDSDCYNACPCLIDDATRSECSFINPLQVESPPKSSDTKYYEESSYIYILLLVNAASAFLAFLLSALFAVLEFRRASEGRGKMREFDDSDAFYH